MADLLYTCHAAMCGKRLSVRLYAARVRGHGLRMQRVSVAMAGVVLSVSARVRGHGWRRAAAFSLHRCSSTSSAVRVHAVFVLCVSWCATCV